MPAAIVALCACVPPVDNVVSASVKLLHDSLNTRAFPTGPGTIEKNVTTPAADVAPTVFTTPAVVDAWIAVTKLEAVAVTLEPIVNSLASDAVARAVNATPFKVIGSPAVGPPVNVPVVEADTAVSAYRISSPRPMACD